MGRTQRRRKKNKLTKPVEPLDHEQRIINLRKFMARNGFSNQIELKLRNFPETGRGVTTKKTLIEGDVIIRVPYKLMITCRTLESLNLFDVFRAGSKLTIHDLLTVFLVLERHKQNSFWSHYISSLPTRPPLLPALLTKDHIDLLPIDFRSAAMKSRNRLQESWWRLQKSIKGDWTCSCCGKKAHCVLDINMFIWGYIIVNTRAVYVNPIVVRPLCDCSLEFLLDEPCMALCPFLDMFNHDHAARTDAELVFEGELFYQLTTLTSVKKYEQIFISYGGHDNIKLLIEYGFFIPANPYDVQLFQSEDIFKILQLRLNKLQRRFFQDHDFCHSSDLFIGEAGPSFNLKALLFVMFTGETKNVATFIYSDSYPAEFLEKLLPWCQQLIYFELKTVKEALRKFEHIKLDCDEHKSLILDFLRFKIHFLQAICDSKL